MHIEWNRVTWYSKLTAVVFFVLILPAWTFYLGIQYQKTIQTTSKSTIETVSDLNFEWKVYRGTGFEISLPSSWKISQGGRAVNNISFYAPDYSDVVDVTVYPMDDKDLTSFAQSFYRRDQVKSIESTIFNTYPAVMLRTRPESGVGSEVFVQHGDVVYGFPDEELQSLTSRKILSTFKFTDL